MERQRRQKEAEQKTIEEQAAKRIEMLVKKRVEEELEKRREEIEQEVNRRVDTAKAEMERDMMLELEKRREQIREEERRREVGARIQISLDDCCYHNIKTITRTINLRSLQLILKHTHVQYQQQLQTVVLKKSYLKLCSDVSNCPTSPVK